MQRERNEKLQNWNFFVRRRNEKLSLKPVGSETWKKIEHVRKESRTSERLRRRRTRTGSTQ